MIISKRVAVAVLGGLAVAGLAGASAASLGGLRADDLGSDDAVIASCDTNGIDIDFTTAYNSTLQAFEVTDVVFGDVAAGCAGQAATVTLSDTADASLTEETGLAASTSFTLTLTTPVLADLVEGIALVITG